MNREQLEAWRGAWDRAEALGAWHPDREHDACGVAFVAHMHGASHDIVRKGLAILESLAHRGATGADPLTGDGAGILLQIPDALLRRDHALPPRGAYGLGMLFVPLETGERAQATALVERIVAEEGLTLLGWREVPTDETQCGDLARASLPAVRQILVTADDDQDRLERRLFVTRKRIGHEADALGLRVYVPSLSTRTVVYKGLLMAHQVAAFYPDLRDPLTSSALCIVHQRFSTNTMPSWERAQPFRILAHNGEINTLRGNVNWMLAREGLFASELFGEDIRKLLPVIVTSGSDSAMLDNALEVLLQTGRSLPHALMMMIPEAWQKATDMSDARHAFYEYHACLMEPWDGPAAVAFTDGRHVGALLDRNGLRPARWLRTRDGLVVMASETGVLEIPPEDIVERERVRPGRMILVDTVEGRLLLDDEIKEAVAARRPYRAWLDEHLVELDDLPGAEGPPALDAGRRQCALRVFGYTREDVSLVVAPMAERGEEPIGSMGNDTPPAALSERSPLLFDYFRQLFAQVTNPPIDPLREELVMSLRTTLGPRRNLFEETPEHCALLALPHPLLTGADLARIEARGQVVRLDTVFAVEGTLAEAVSGLCEAAAAAVRDGATLLVLTDRRHDELRAPMPSLLATAAVHHHLIREGLRGRCALVVDSGEPREVMHVCLLLGYGAGAIHPWMAFEAVRGLIAEGTLVGVGQELAEQHVVKALCKGIKKVMSKMGISTLDSYRGAQIFEAIGLQRELVDQWFTRTATRLGGAGIEDLAGECRARHSAAWSGDLGDLGDLGDGGRYRWRRDGERHAWNPGTIGLLQHAVRKGSYAQFKRYTAAVNAESAAGLTLRGLLELVPAGDPVPLAEVEPASAIVKRFKTGAMSLGAISPEAHEVLAIAMNRLGGQSNTGEGGEDPARFGTDANGDSRRSAIKQVASGRFGVTSHYLVNADELQIKMAQGAKPGEGGQLPGHKVDDHIAWLRHSTPGVGLISPPPHHDIYSIEDLAQLIHDLKNANDRARISVKLVAEVGVGTVAAGVAKAGADVILVSGDSGGTGAAPLSSIRHAGVPWELGLSEAHQVLVLNRLRGRVRLETDGQLKTGRDVAVAAMLGAEEFGFATAALVASGCILMRACHLNTCPVGVATQDPRLRARFAGKPEHVTNMMTFIAEELREIMASLGVRRVDDLVGRTDLLRQRDCGGKASRLDLSGLLHRPELDTPTRWVEPQDHGLDEALDRRLIVEARPALERRAAVRIEARVTNEHRTVGTLLSAEVSRRFGREGLPPETIRLDLRGTGGQSFGAFLAPGLDVHLEGEANDYFGKGMSGGRLVVVPPAAATFAAEDNVIVGNVALYGATAGEVFIRGIAGERFAVRNSGATAVVEALGDHGCEYMTGGAVLVLGPIGRNFAAGMSGGVAWLYDGDGQFWCRVNHEMVDLERPGEEDLATIRALIRRHVDLTGSALGWRLLSGWRTAAPRFVKVMPVEYRKALERTARRAR
ncbi:MAG: glutamate synthase [Myxococcales bacterium]